MRGLAWVSRHESVCGALDRLFGATDLPVELFGLRFPNPVGLAAGMDKHATALPAWESLGFGFTELGAVTFHPQPGNPSPRVFRAIRELAIVNRMGFNNPGAEELAQTLSQWRASGRWPHHPVGINLGKSKITPMNEAAEDYANSFRLLREHADFFVINVSSPNTPNLRQLQDKAALDAIIVALMEARKTGNPRPILVKVAPDLSFEALDDILELAETRQLDGIIATNTTITRPETTSPSVQRVYAETGGLSGKPLRTRSTEVIRHIYRQTKGNLPIIGVGGIFNAEDAWEKIVAGASLLQVYTGFIYQGPSLAKTIVRGLVRKLQQAGFSRLQQAVGSKASGLL